MWINAVLLVVLWIEMQYGSITGYSYRMFHNNLFMECLTHPTVALFLSSSSIYIWLLDGSILCILEVLIGERRQYCNSSDGRRYCAMLYLSNVYMKLPNNGGT